MARLQCTGPVDIWAGVGFRRDLLGGGLIPRRRVPNDSFQPQFLGHTEKGPHIEVVHKFRNLKSDAAGDAPADVAWLGEEAFVSCDINRWNEEILASITSRPVYYQQRGVTARRDIGSLMVRNRLTFQLWLRFPYALRDPLMPAGYFFPFAYLLGPDKLNPLGTRARKVQLIFHALRVQLNGTAGGYVRAGGGPGGYVNANTLGGYVRVGAGGNRAGARALPNTYQDPAPLYLTDHLQFAVLPPLTL